jgi:hypothetical protein
MLTVWSLQLSNFNLCLTFRQTAKQKNQSKQTKAKTIKEGTEVARRTKTRNVLATLNKCNQTKLGTLIANWTLRTIKVSYLVCRISKVQVIALLHMFTDKKYKSEQLLARFRPYELIKI